MNNNEIYKQAFKQFALLVFWLLAARYSRGASLVVMIGLGMYWALFNKVGKAFAICVMIMLMVVLSTYILPKDSLFYSFGLRGGPMLIGLVLAFRGLIGRSNMRIPIGGMVLYLAVAAVSSFSGWSPIVSYLKLINFAVFFVGVWLGSQRLNEDAREVLTLRATFFALAVFVVIVSLALIPFPYVSTLQGVRQHALMDNAAAAGAVEYLEVRIQADATLFCGVMYHSQAFGAILSCIVAWLMCDMLFCEGKLRWPHLILLICALPLLYKTRSRVAMLSLFVALTLIFLYLPRRVPISKEQKRRLDSFRVVAGVIICLLVVVLEYRSSTFSRWIRKTDEVEGDRRSLGEAVTSSRQGLIEMCLTDLKARPFLGMGFQVAYYTPYLTQGSFGIILSSPIEKGVLPVMVLGETGIIGFLVFLLTAGYFCSVGAKKRLYITISLTGVFCAVNMGEATFFSPGGPGGIEWYFCVLGGYALDLTLIKAPFSYRAIPRGIM